jgi:hypothetical protein
MLRRLAPAVLAVTLLAGCGGSEELTAGGAATAPAPAAAPPPAATPDATSPDATSPDAVSPAAPTAAPTPGAATDDAQQVTLTVAGGQVTGDTGRVEVPAGALVRMTVLSDVDDEVHVHGYDRVVPLAAGTPAQVELVADAPGVFEVELHDARLLLTRLQVR